ncbi:MAG: hypothetical protein D6693_03200 [Planctomycetota bacterium]|nr:MAG: hypothetical protein D6693_03200 [Planctomycetota bacterium]
MPSPRHILRVASTRLTRRIARRWGAGFPMHCVIEPAKCGGTWLSQMLADCLRLPLPRHSLLPIAMPAVLHGHWPADPRLPNVVYLTRDGRDVAVSLYFHILRRATTPGDPVAGPRRRLLERLAGPGVAIDDARAMMPRLIEFVHTPGRSRHAVWAEHVRGWRACPGVTHTSYEALRADTAGELTRILRALTGADPDPWLVGVTVEKHSMQRQTGRTAGEEDRTSFIRKGVVGDWKNYFDLECRRLFDRLAGDALIEFGYEPDRSWVDRETPADRGPGGDVSAGAGPAAPSASPARS